VRDGGNGPAATARYALAGGADGKRRLDVLARVHGEPTLDLLRAAGIRPGMRCLDVGCGGGHVSLEMARLVGRWGRVVGVDGDPEVVELAAADARAAGFENVELAVGDALALDVPSDFHLAYARFLLSHVAEPGRVLAGMARALEPGGVVAVEDVDFRGAFSHPPCRELAASLELYRAVVRERGGDADLGPRLPELLRDSGFEVLGVRVVQPAFLDGEGKLLPWLTLAKVSDAVVASGLATRAKVDRTLAGLLAFSERSDTLVAHVRTMQCWGRRIA